MTSGALAAIISGIVLTIFYWIAARTNKKLEAEMDEGDFIIRQPKFALWLGIILTLFFVLVQILCTVDANTLEDSLLMLACLSPLMLFGLFIVASWCKWKIIVRGNQITSASLFGKEKTYAFAYITTVKRGLVATKGGDLDTVIAYHGKKKLFRVTEICTGFNVLASRLESEGVFIIGIKDKLPLV
jgi:hypothetical protein